MLHRVEEEPYRNRDDSRDTHQRTDWLTDFDSDEEEQPLISKQKQLTAALCKCVLDPRNYDNYLFWELVYNKNIQDPILQALKDLNFTNGQETSTIENHGVFLGASGDVHYFACWPYIEEVVYSFKTFLSQEELKSILLSCCVDSSKKPQLSALIDGQYQTLPPAPYRPIHFGDTNFTRGPQGYIGKDIHFKSSCASIWLQILGGFIAALGTVAIVVALTLLTPPATVVAVSGAAALIVGLGMFKIGRDKPKELSSDNTVAQSNWCPSL